MLEKILTIAVVAGAALWLFLWLRSTSKNGGCSCGKGDGCCGKKADGCSHGAHPE